MNFGVRGSLRDILRSSGAATMVCGACLQSRRAFIAMAAAGATLAAAPGFAVFTKPRRPVIDFHTHMCDKELLEMKGGFPGPPQSGVSDRLFNPAAHIEDMDRFGVDMHVVTMSNALQGISWGGAKSDLVIHKRINDEIANAWIARFPKRFVGACTLPMQDLTLALPELERCVKNLGFKVVEISSATPNGLYYGDPALRPFWDMVHSLGVTVFIHPHLNASAPPLDDFGMANSIGQGIEEAKVMGSIIYQGLYDHYPDLKIVVAHGGGFLPHYYGRMDRNVNNYPSSARLIKRKPSDYLRMFYYDSCVYNPAILEALIKIVGIDKIVLGGDYPVGVFDAVGELKQLKTLSSMDVEQITSRNAAKLLGL